MIMIDEKEIRKAAIINADYFNPCRSTLDREEACRASFEDGVDWFKKALWHTEDEIPEADRLILVKGKTNETCGDYGLLNTPKDLDIAGFDRKSQWESFCKLADLDFTWCYIEDLLPKGGEK